MHGSGLEQLVLLLDHAAKRRLSSTMTVSTPVYRLRIILYFAKVSRLPGCLP